jgi:polar amino acid transport system substrate-binding protein
VISAIGASDVGLASGGRLRAAINLGNPVLAERPADGRLGGISVRLAQALAGQLDLELDLIPSTPAGNVVEAA